MAEHGREPELELLERARAGDEEAFCALFDPHAPALLVRIGRTLPTGVSRRFSTADVLQEVRIAAHDGLPSFEWRGEGSLRAWLLRIAENRAKAGVRHNVFTAKRGLNNEVSRSGRPVTAAFAGGGRSPSEAAMAAEDRIAVRDTLDQLPEDYREVLQLVFREQLTLREAGERMGRSREATKKLYRRALASFARAHDEGNDHDEE